MDPNATVQAILDAIEAQDRVAVRELFDTLAEWIRRGGFAPSWRPIEARMRKRQSDVWPADIGRPIWSDRVSDARYAILSPVPGIERKHKDGHWTFREYGARGMELASHDLAD